MSYGYQGTYTIDATQCGSANSTDFPVLLQGTVAEFATVANGGKVQNVVNQTVGSRTISVPADLALFSDSGATTLTSWEWETYNATSGAYRLWAKQPSLTFGANSFIYVRLGDAAVTTLQTTPTSAWNSGYKLVAHQPDGTTLNLSDSTASGNNGSNNGATAGTGQINGCAAFDGSRQDWSAASSTDFNAGTGDFTVESWFNITDRTNYQVIVGKDVSGARQWTLNINGNGGNVASWNDLSTGAFPHVSTTTTISNSTWYCLGVTRVSGTVTIYLNGVGEATLSDSSDLSATNTTYVGAREFIGTEQHFGGLIDEVRFSKGVGRSASYMLSSYNNQKSSSTFVSLGSITPVGGVTTHFLSSLGVGS